MSWIDTLKKIAPTVASALGGPLAGVAVTAIGELFGMAEPTADKIQAAIENSQLTGEQITGLRQLELKLKAEEQERSFRYAELEFKDRDSARKASVEGGTMGKLFGLSIILLAITLGTEVGIMFNGLPPDVNELVVGRVLGLMDAIALTVMSFWYGTSSGSVRKTDLMNTAK